MFASFQIVASIGVPSPREFDVRETMFGRNNDVMGIGVGGGGGSGFCEAPKRDQTRVVSLTFLPTLLTRIIFLRLLLPDPDPECSA
jgi:hypothetical protein